MLLEQCEKKARKLGFPDEWFVPGGKVERDDASESYALMREIREEWPTVRVEEFEPLPLVEGSNVGGDDDYGVFLMRPYRIKVSGELGSASSEGTPLKWVPVVDALSSPVPQVRMMVAAAMELGHYELVRDEIQHAPPTWCPGYLRAAIERSVGAMVFKPDGGLQRYVHNVLEHMGERAT